MKKLAVQEIQCLCDFWAKKKPIFSRYFFLFIKEFKRLQALD